ELLRELLEGRGYTVEEACHGQEALQKIAEARPDVLLLDLSMPVMDGFATIKNIRASAEIATLPVLAVTAFAMRGDQEKTVEAGFDGYLSKPINPSALDEALKKIEEKISGAKAAHS